MPVCPHCNGTGRVHYEEEGRQVEDACYHCAETGEISEEQAFADRVSEAAERLAMKHVVACKHAADHDESGEGWAFHAAENMMTEHDYTTAKVMEYTERYKDEFAKLSPWALPTLLDVILPTTD